MNKHLLTAVSATVLMAVGASGCRSKPTPPPVERPVVAVEPPALVRAWKAKLDLRGQRVHQLHLSDEFVFVYTGGREVYVFDRASGTRVNLARLNGRPTHPPVVTEDNVVYPTDSTLEVYDKRGRFVRSVAVGNTIRTGVVQSGDRLALGVDHDGRGRVLFVDVTKPYRDVTPIQTARAISAAPASRQGVTYVGSEDGSVYAISPENAAAWALPGGVFKTAGAIVADLAADQGATANVYVASTDSKLYALNAGSGQIRWQYYAGAALTTGPTVTAENIYLSVPGTGLVAIDKTTGESIRKAKWSLIDATQLLAEDAQHAYVLGTGNRVYGVDRKTGKVTFTSQRTDLSIFAQNTKDGTIYAATPAGEIIAAAPVLTSGKMGELVMDDAAAHEVVALGSR